MEGIVMADKMLLTQAIDERGLYIYLDTSE